MAVRQAKVRYKINQQWWHGYEASGPKIESVLKIPPMKARAKFEVNGKKIVTVYVQKPHSWRIFNQPGVANLVTAANRINQFNLQPTSPPRKIFK